MYRTALKYDPALALAYTGLAGIYWSKNYYREYFQKAFSILFLSWQKKLFLLMTSYLMHIISWECIMVRKVIYNKHLKNLTKR